MDIYLHSPLHPYGLVLNYFSKSYMYLCIHTYTGIHTDTAMLSAAETVHVYHALLAVCVSFSLRGRGTKFQDGIAAGESFLCAPF
jgi:hypothetical protein